MMLLCLVGGLAWHSLLSVQLNLACTAVLCGDESGGGGDAGGACVAGIFPVSKLNIMYKCISGRLYLSVPLDTARG